MFLHPVFRMIKHFPEPAQRLVSLEDYIARIITLFQTSIFYSSCLSHKFEMGCGSAKTKHFTFSTLTHKKFWLTLPTFILCENLLNREVLFQEIKKKKKNKRKTHETKQSF